MSGEGVLGLKRRSEPKPKALEKALRVGMNWKGGNVTGLFFWMAVVTTLIFAVTNGMKDGANVAATAIASRSFSPAQTILIVTCAEFFGPFLLGTRVAATVSGSIINTDMLRPGTGAVLLVLGGMLGAFAWNLLTWQLSLPTSSSFTLVGGMIGPALLEYHLSGVPWSAFFIKVLLAMFLSPILGMGFGYIVYWILEAVLRRVKRRGIEIVKKLQIVTLVLLGVNHGTNDSQKSMGIIALLLFVSGTTPTLAVPFWVKFCSIAAITFGVTIGGSKIIKTVGYGIFRVEPHHSFGSQIAATSILIGCNALGAPVSTTQIVSSSVMGVGSRFRRKGVRWVIIRDIFWSWILTIPLAAAAGAGIYWVLKAAFL
ncbi:MAG: anion permease [Candidatus Hydrogenedentota bacterium]|nr:MAG: anion permease [Candidatus Hydrogenedentota bacterium]